MDFADGRSVGLLVGTDPKSSIGADCVGLLVGSEDIVSVCVSAGTNEGLTASPRVLAA